MIQIPKRKHKRNRKKTLRGKKKRARKRRRIPVAQVVQTLQRLVMCSQQVWPQTILLLQRIRRLKLFFSRYLTWSAKTNTSYKKCQIWKSNRNWTKTLSKLSCKTVLINQTNQCNLRGLTRKIAQNVRPLAKTKTRLMNTNNNLLTTLPKLYTL